MPRNQHFPQARRRRRPTARHALIGVALAFVALLVVPAAAPRGTVLDLEGAGQAQQAIAQGSSPAPTITTPAPSPSPAVPATPSPAVTATPTPAVTPSSAPATATPTAPASTEPSPSVLPSPAVTSAPSPTSSVTPSPIAVPWPVTTAPPVESLTGYRWPVRKVRLTLPFGPTVWGSRLVDGESFHDGVDLATFCGDRITAAHDGVVLAAGRRYDRVMGWIGDLDPYLRRLDTKNLWMTLPIVVVTDDGNGYRSMYAHFSRIVVKQGQRVKAGQLLGYEGMTGRASGCHVHYGLFSPLETATVRIRPDVVKRMKLPKREIARIDPLLVLPPKPGVNAPKVPKASATP